MTSTETPLRTPPLFYMGCYAFVSLGVSAALLGPALPALAIHAGATFEQIGLIFTSMSLGYLFSAPIINFAGARFGIRMLLIVSPLFVISSMMLLIFGLSLAVFMLATFLLGLGQSGTQVSYNAIFGTQNSSANASAKLNRMNAFFGVGALIGPLLVAAGYTLGDPFVAFWIAAGLALPLTLSAALWTDRAQLEVARPTTQSNASLEPQANPLRSPVLIAMCVVMGLYVGCEVAFSGWTTEFTRRVVGVETAQAAIAVSAFWLGLSISRYFSNAWVKRILPTTFVLLVLGVSATGLIIMMPSNTLLISLLGAFIVGLGFGPIYPTLVAIGIQCFPYAAQLVASVLTSAGSLGALFLPALTGIVLNASIAGAINAWLLLLALVGLIALIWLFVRRKLNAGSERPPG